MSEQLDDLVKRLELARSGGSGGGSWASDAALLAEAAAAIQEMAAEREACALIADAYANDPNCISDRGDYWAKAIAKEIRQRGTLDTAPSVAFG